MNRFFMSPTIILLLFIVPSAYAYDYNNFEKNLALIIKRTNRINALEQRVGDWARQTLAGRVLPSDFNEELEASEATDEEKESWRVLLEYMEELNNFDIDGKSKRLSLGIRSALDSKIIKRFDALPPNRRAWILEQIHKQAKKFFEGYNKNPYTQAQEDGVIPFSKDLNVDSTAEHFKAQLESQEKLMGLNGKIPYWQTDSVKEISEAIRNNPLVAVPLVNNILKGVGKENLKKIGVEAYAKNEILGNVIFAKVIGVSDKIITEVAFSYYTGKNNSKKNMPPGHFIPDELKYLKVPSLTQNEKITHYPIIERLIIQRVDDAGADFGAFIDEAEDLFPQVYADTFGQSKNDEGDIIGGYAERQYGWWHLWKTQRYLIPNWMVPDEADDIFTQLRSKWVRGAMGIDISNSGFTSDDFITALPVKLGDNLWGYKTDEGLITDQYQMPIMVSGDHLKIMIEIIDGGARGIDFKSKFQKRIGGRETDVEGE